ncbi:MAG TPA: leucyl aminopeptidase, partial [Gammaproteobacteria bacterium]|nr:leucyl aminopeptidase [Gammaproteobacteria bacterium]
ANGSDLARDLGNRPPNVCTPSHLADVARGLAKKFPRMHVKVLTEVEMKRLGMGALLSVTQGAEEPARLIVLEYRGAPSKVAPIALCGKGVTFDTGGISLKPPPKMDEMKFDMCGAGSVLGALAAIGELAPACNVVGVIPACENMPGGRATVPGDIVKSMSGQTIEIINTDAEGRLILCDAITYARRYKPRCLIDVATLTGAAVVALGHVYTGVFSPDDKLAAELVAAGDRALDLAWRMPVHEEYGETLRSNFADFANSGTRDGGASVAANFLARFTEGLRWAHLDIAGVAWRANSHKGATGRPVPLLVDFLLSSERQ